MMTKLYKVHHSMTTRQTSLKHTPTPRHRRPIRNQASRQKRPYRCKNAGGSRERATNVGAKRSSAMVCSIKEIRITKANEVRQATLHTLHSV